MTSAPQLPNYLGIPFRILVSPFVHFDPETRTTDIMMFNSRNLGALIVAEEPHVKSWEDGQYNILNMSIEETAETGSCRWADRRGRAERDGSPGWVHNDGLHGVQTRGKPFSFPFAAFPFRCHKITLNNAPAHGLCGSPALRAGGWNGSFLRSQRVSVVPAGRCGNRLSRPRKLRKSAIRRRPGAEIPAPTFPSQRRTQHPNLRSGAESGP